MIRALHSPEATGPVAYINIGGLTNLAIATGRTCVFTRAVSSGICCTCWGSVELSATEDPKDRELVESKRHVPRLISTQPRDGSRFRPAPFETHTDEEMDILQKCVGRRSPILVPGGDEPAK